MFAQFALDILFTAQFDNTSQVSVDVADLEYSQLTQMHNTLGRLKVYIL